MRSAIVAEWVIARFTDRERAAAVVGDLLELAPERGPLWFWSGVAGTVLAATWRRLVGFGTAYLCLALLQWRDVIVARRMLLERQMIAAARGVAALPPIQIDLVHIVIAVLAFSVTVAAAYAVICYGLRDEFARLALAVSAPSLLLMFYWSKLAVVLSASSVLLGVLIYFVASGLRRRATLALAVALVAGYCGFRFILYLWPWYLQLVPLSPLGYSLSAASLPVLDVILQVVACDWAHWLVCDRTRRPLETAHA
ncbi:MAG TPA: hypothetical protein VMF66_19195 [Candidatus Acidoferrum sp.]|nr:hypothetical protein [Candidatus Acidoferrum sp.]